MITYYDVTKSLHDYLISDEDINRVLIGDVDQIDTDKQDIFPLAHILIGSVTPSFGVMQFSVTISTMDVIDINNDNPTKGDWKGHDNKQNILNTMLAVLENLYREIDKGNLSDSGWELANNPTFEPFEDRFINLLTGWSATFTINIPNKIQNC